MQPRNSNQGAGRLTLHYHNWVCITQNSFILNIIKYGLKLNFSSPPPMLSLSPFPFSPSQALAISNEVSTLLSKTAIAVIDPDPDQCVNQIFPVPKKDSGDYRVILNLKILNEYIHKSKFKLEGYSIIINMICRGDFMCSIDMRDAFLMVSMFPDFFRFLCFIWEGVRYCYTCMPFGLTSAPRIFTKIMKCVLVFLRSRGLRVTAFFDDLIIFAESASLLLEHLHFACLILKSLGFLINETKSSFVPCQRMLHLGFIWDSLSFTLSVPSEKVADLKLLCNTALAGPVSLRFLQRILGTVESFRLAFPMAALHYRHLQREVASKVSSGVRWDRKIVPSVSSKLDLKWWSECPISLLPRSLAPFAHDISVTTDSSSFAWGAYSSLNTEVSGQWSEEETALHINVLEMKAVLFAFYSLFRNHSNVSILVKCDNTTAVSYINNYGGVRSPDITDLVVELYDFCLLRGISIKASYLEGRRNVRADALSRRSRDHCYSLPSHLFLHFCSHFNISPLIDLFASRENAKLNCYISDGPDPQAIGFDAFCTIWPNCIYAFPPVVLIDKFISCFKQLPDMEGLLIVPFWPGQPYFSTLLSIIIDIPVLFSASLLEGTAAAPKPLSKLLACVISSRVEKQKDFLQNLSQNCSDRWIQKHSQHTAATSSIITLGWLEGVQLYATPLSI